MNLIIYNSKDQLSRNFLTTIPAEAWQDWTILDYYKNDETSIKILDDLRSLNIHCSIFPTVIIKLPPSPVTKKETWAICHGVSDFNQIEGIKWEQFCLQIIEDTHPISDKIRVFKDQLCLIPELSTEIISKLLLCQTEVQLQGMYKKLILEEKITKLEKQILEKCAEENKLIIKLSQPELVLVKV